MSFHLRRSVRPELDPLAGDAQPHEKDFTSHRDEVIIGDIETATHAEAELARRHAAARRVQSIARMWIHRARLVRHLAILKGDISVLTIAKQTRCATLLQRCLRGLLQRLRYKKLLAAEEARIAAEAAKKSTKKGSAKAGATGVAKGAKPDDTKPAAQLTVGEQALQRNMNFVAGYKAFAAGRLDEAIHGFDAQLKVKPDAVTERLLTIARAKKDGAPPSAAAAGGAAGAAGKTGSGTGKDRAPSKKK